MITSTNPTVNLIPEQETTFPKSKTNLTTSELVNTFIAIKYNLDKFYGVVIDTGAL
jgi:hypothetical protein